MIEVAQKKQWFSVSQDDAKLRMFVLGDGWRFPTFVETHSLQFPMMVSPVWNTDTINNPELDKHHDVRRVFIPVRDLKDD